MRSVFSIILYILGAIICLFGIYLSLRTNIRAVPINGAIITVIGFLIFVAGFVIRK